jgi:hypothetical protein
MNTNSIKPRSRCGAPIGIQAKAVGTHSLDAINHQYERRTGIDRSSTVYHVLTGVPASDDGYAMTGMNWSEATEGMLSFSLCNEQRRCQARGVISRGIERATS